jgi:hypothetical protein
MCEANRLFRSETNSNDWNLEQIKVPRLFGAHGRQTTTAPLMTAAPRVIETKRAKDAPCPYSDLSTFQNTGVAGPSSTPVSDLRHALGAKYWPSGT